MSNKTVLNKRLFQGDCLDLMKDIPDNSIDLILTDLPYGVTSQNNWDSIIPMGKLWEQWNRIKKINTPIILFGQGIFTANLMKSNEKLWRYNLIWSKNRSTGHLNAKKMPLRSHEDIVIFYEKLPVYNPQKYEGRRNHTKSTGSSVKNHHTYNDHTNVDNSKQLGMMKYPRSILEFNKPLTQLHPTEKPVKLFEYLINTYSNKNDLVLDCCAGSGTTAIACFNSDRDYICIEKEEKYFSIIQKRIQKLPQKLELFI